MDPFPVGVKSEHYLEYYMETCMLLCFHVHIYRKTCMFLLYLVLTFDSTGKVSIVHDHNAIFHLHVHVSYNVYTSCSCSPTIPALPCNECQHSLVASLIIFG